jgi:peptide/nickel transport system substrate-binding protein
MRGLSLLAPIATLAAALAAASPAAAQKSKDTLRLAINDPFSIMSSYCVPLDEVGYFSRGIYDTLIAYDEHNRKFVPQLAKSWTRINPTTVEFELRDDVVFHNGNKFDADDVITTDKFLQDPAIKIQYKNRYGWIKKIEKLSPYKIRIEAHEVMAVDLQMIAYRFRIQDAESYNTLTDKCDYGRLTPYGTGPYKVVSVDRNQGILVERFDGSKLDPKYSPAPIKRIHGVPLPDRQTQVAQLLTGGIDIVRNVSPDNAAELAKHPNLEVSVLPTASFYYIVLDAAGRSGHKAVQDPRVRKAILLAIDRDALIKNIVPGGRSGVAEKMMGFCFASNTGCQYSVKYDEYNPAEAKRLLAEAGYADGFDIVYDVFAPVKAIGEAIAGELRKVGIRATVNSVPINVFYKKWTGGETSMVSVAYPTSSFPDVGNILDTFFGGVRDYAHDPVIQKAMEDGERELDPAKRADIYEKALNRMTEMSYVMAVSSVPTVFAHSKDTGIKKSALRAGDYTINDHYWK